MRNSNNPIYLITGGAGFIGSNISRTLVENGIKVRIIDNFFTGKWENISDIKDEIELIEGDIRNAKLVNQAMQGIKYVIHQAAIPSVPRSLADPIATHTVNTTGTLILLKAAVDANVERFVSASSSSVYGDQPVLPKKEDMLPAPLSPYALSKLIGEQYCSIFNKHFNLTSVSLRYFNVFGPFQDPQSDYAAVIPAFISAYLENRPPKIHGDGLQTRDFTFINNVVDANLAACRVKNVDTCVLNIGTGKRTSVLELALTIKKILKSEQIHIFEPKRAGDVKDSLADISKANTILGYNPKISFEDALKETIQWYQSLI